MQRFVSSAVNMEVLLFHIELFVCNRGDIYYMYIQNGCLDAYEVKVNKDTFKYQAKVK